ncbi:AAA family ATPase [Photobacterium kishitanii]|uniref:sigma 54-interacting transcriptional regulator n=1 Tax=Photobacterium kishitanii TaxID=318456 RepID=UPI0005D430EB|nr:sigma 54-interacting transcriptional regulator [Photobacterium kishitanii]KJG09070.1 ATPase AAA [Photobacterium kishitanii]PSV06663.1 AAA family ATPase [Photobacterium kishitanii]PSV15613.1 AAA family ATPase [Photobacterium kishitanii]PSV77590.1 AAA family ATPase [Photobacterium kishitanii]PSW60361.1 AAA family ATPase [Photobacterium kishitanii]
MENFESDLMIFSKALLSINDISGVINFLNNESLLFIDADRVNIILKDDINAQSILYYQDADKNFQRYDYSEDNLSLHHVVSCEYSHYINGEELYRTFPQLSLHPAYTNIQTYCKIPLLIANQQLGAIEYINLRLPSYDDVEKQFKLFNNMVAAMIEHILEHQIASSLTQQLSNEHKNYQFLVDITNAVINQSSKKELIGSLLHFLYQRFGMNELSIIQSQDGHYNQYSGGDIEGEIDYQCHFFTDDSMIKNAVENNKAVILTAADIYKLRRDDNSPYFSALAKSACVMPMIFRGVTIGYICYVKAVETQFEPSEIELFKQISARVALAMHSIKVHQSATPHRSQTKFISVEDSYDEHAIFDDIISQSEVMNKVLEQVALVASCDSTVLILGESGTGKELIARAIHKMSHRSKTEMVKMNCAAIPSGLFESELFGHERGAFTGAVTQRVGRFEQAHKGTLFLDEIGDMPLELQPKLLRALQENEIERVGKNQLISVDVRIVVATNVNLLQMVQQKQFRNDLYYRLNVFPIEIPPLRERAEDIPLLVKHFTRELAKKMGKTITSIAAEDMAIMQQFSWPGNVRELRNVIERSVILTRGQVLNVPTQELVSLPPILANTPAEQVEPQAVQSSSVKSAPIVIDRQMIIDALISCHGVIAGPNGVANQLGLKRTTLLSRMQKMGLNSQDYR